MRPRRRDRGFGRRRGDYPRALRHPRVRRFQCRGPRLQGPLHARSAACNRRHQPGQHRRRPASRRGGRRRYRQRRSRLGPRDPLPGAQAPEIREPSAAVAPARENDLDRDADSAGQDSPPAPDVLCHHLSRALARSLSRRRCAGGHEGRAVLRRARQPAGQDRASARPAGVHPPRSGYRREVRGLAEFHLDRAGRWLCVSRRLPALAARHLLCGAELGRSGACDRPAGRRARPHDGRIQCAMQRARPPGTTAPAVLRARTGQIVDRVHRGRAARQRTTAGAGPSWHADRRPSTCSHGHHLAWAFTSGRLAGRYAAEEAGSIG